NPEAIMEAEWEQRQLAYEILKVDREVAIEMNQPSHKELFQSHDWPDRTVQKEAMATTML
ncbi:hypothetical protein BGZ65_007005, partial [Modicella reniformis]